MLGERVGVWRGGGEGNHHFCVDLTFCDDLLLSNYLPL